ncbi:PepSY domain-containing protein [Neptunomonas antarctica]|uniref:Peptidase propeptide and YPEB domain-containing protein n=1 Tax=Neptunomonas antarctica TaxID=619304 RepID=A0A1N7LJF0_9GAMM|nr:PepSY domain-containing protein [Neptunomonas antarctica]SIS73960.1 Peptidase propeptide and YPEB domain-containing protein [Neptunomonas antarctica]
MKKFKQFIVAAVIGGLTLTGASMIVPAKSLSANDVLAVSASSITLEQAVSIAQKTVVGTPAKVEVSTDHGAAVWDVEMIDNNQQVSDIEIDAISGKVLKRAADKANMIH